MADAYKEARKTQYFAKLRNVPSSPRKMRLVVDMVRGQEVFKALGILKFSNKEASRKVEKLLRSAIANWDQKNAVLRQTAQRAQQSAQNASRGRYGSRSGSLQSPRYPEVLQQGGFTQGGETSP